MEVCDVAAFSPELLQNHTDLYRKHSCGPVSVQNGPDWQVNITTHHLGHTGTYI